MNTAGSLHSLHDPRTQIRGLIEARDGDPVMQVPAPSIRGLRSAASLKRVEGAISHRVCDAIRGLRSAASLKLEAMCVGYAEWATIRGLRSAASLKRSSPGSARERATRIDPRTQIRGLIEAP